MIVDAHIHWPMEQDGSCQPLLDTMDRYGISHAVLCGYEVLWKLGTARRWNDRLAGFCRAGGGRLVPLATVHLAEKTAALDEARRCVDTLHVKGFKVHPWVQGETVFCETMEGLCAIAGRAGVPLMFHDGTPAYAMSSQIGVLAAAFPDTTFVLGHGGILHFWEEAVEVARQFRNVVVTLCGQHLRGMQAVCDAIEADRIMWGTDFVGRGAEDFIAYRKGLVERLRLTPAQREHIMAGTAQRFFGVSAT